MQRFRAEELRFNNVNTPFVFLAFVVAIEIGTNPIALGQVFLPPSLPAQSGWHEEVPEAGPYFQPPPGVSEARPPFVAVSAVDNSVESKPDFASLRESIEAQEKELAEIKEQLDGVVKPGHSKATMKVVGRIHLDHWAFPGDSPGVNAFETGDTTMDPQDRVVFRRMRFGVRGGLPANMEYRIEMEFAGGDETQYRDVFLGWKELPLLQTLRIGNQKRPYGLDHLNSSRYNVFIERPFVVEGFNQDARRLGIVSYGVSEDERFNWRYGAYNLRLVQDESGFIDDHYQSEFAGRFAHTFCYNELCDGRNYAHWAISGSAAHPDGSAPNNGVQDNEAQFRTRPEARSSSRWLDTGKIEFADWYQLLGVESVVNLGPWQWVGEYQNVWLQRDPGGGPDLHFHGGYMYLSYFLTGEHIPWERDSGTLGRVEPFRNFWLTRTPGGMHLDGWGAWQLAVRWSYADFSSEDILGGVGESVTAGLNWHWTPYARMQFNYIYGRVDDHRVDLTGGPGAGTDPVLSGDYHVLGTRFMVDF